MVSAYIRVSQAHGKPVETEENKGLTAPVVGSLLDPAIQKIEIFDMFSGGKIEIFRTLGLSEIQLTLRVNAIFRSTTKRRWLENPLSTL